MESNSSRHVPTKDHGAIVDTSSKRPRNNGEGIKQPVIPVKKFTGVIVGSDRSTGTTPTSVAARSSQASTSSVGTSSSSSNTRMSGNLDKGKSASSVTATSRAYEELPKLDLRPYKRQKTVSGDPQQKYKQQQQYASSSSASSSSSLQPILSSSSSSAAATAAAVPSSLPAPTPSPLRQVPTVIDLTLDDEDDEPPRSPPPTRWRVFSSQKRMRSEPANKKTTSSTTSNDVSAKRTKKKPINYLMPFSDSNSDDSDSSKDGATTAAVAVTNRDRRSRETEENQTQKRQFEYQDDEDELDELFEEEEEEATNVQEKDVSAKATSTTTSKHDRTPDDDVGDSDGILEDADEEQENQEIINDEGDEELESIGIKYGTPKKSHDVVTSEVDELQSSQDPDDNVDIMGDDDDDNGNHNVPARPLPTPALSFQHSQHSVDKDTENNDGRDKTATASAMPEPLKTNLNGPLDDFGIPINSPPLSPSRKHVDPSAPISKPKSPVQIQNTDPAATEKSSVISKTIERDTIMVVPTVASEAITAQEPSSSPSAVTAKESTSNEHSPNRQYVSTTPPSTMLSSSSSALSDKAVDSYEEGSRYQTDHTAMANAMKMKNRAGSESIDEEAGGDNDDEDDDFYSAQQAGSPLSDEFVTAEPNRSSTVDGVETDLDYKRMSRHKLKTGYVYDVVMSLHAQLGQPGDDDDPHPEDPRRIYSIYKCMEENGLLNNCTKLPIRQATKAEILATHDPRYYQTLRQTEVMSRKELEKQAGQYNSIYLNAHSHESALFSAGGVIEACSAVVTDKVQNAFAIVRPPGHHAEYDTAMGFCLMNNVAIAARYCKDHFPYVERILILDWDIHFGNYNTNTMHDREKTHDELDTDSGNGTQQLTSSDGDILYMSLHRYEKGTFYPQDNHGRHSYVGRGKGRGRTVNIPWPNSGMTDGDYLYAFRQIVMPIAMEFGPSLVIVSAGFDAAAGDYIGECHVTPAGYGQMTHMLKSLANGRVVLALEGGYNLESIAKSAYACMSVLVGESPEIPTLLTPSPECVETVQKVKQIQSQYWDSLKY